MTARPAFFGDWDSLYRRGRQGKYPSEMLIRFINSTFPPGDRAHRKVLDLGFGTGRHLIYLAEEGFQTYGIEASATGVAIAREWLADKSLHATIATGSALDTAFGDEEFDAVIDVSSIQHNVFPEMRRIMDAVYAMLKPGGCCFSVQKTQADSLFQTGTHVEGITYAFPEGVDKVINSTIISFTSLPDVTTLYSRFSKVRVEKEEWTYANMTKTVSHWIVTAQKQSDPSRDGSCGTLPLGPPTIPHP